MQAREEGAADLSGHIVVLPLWRPVCMLVLQLGLCAAHTFEYVRGSLRLPQIASYCLRLPRPLRGAHLRVCARRGSALRGALRRPQPDRAPGRAFCALNAPLKPLPLPSDSQVRVGAWPGAASRRGGWG